MKRALFWKLKVSFILNGEGHGWGRETTIYNTFKGRFKNKNKVKVGLKLAVTPVNLV